MDKPRCFTRSIGVLAFVLIVTVFQTGILSAGEFIALKKQTWKGEKASTKSDNNLQHFTQAYPEKRALGIVDEKTYSPGTYQLKLKVSASHTHDHAAWKGGLNVSIENAKVIAHENMNTFDAHDAPKRPFQWSALNFYQPDVPQELLVEFRLEKAGPLNVKLQAEIAGREFDKNIEREVADGLRKPSIDDDGGEEEDLDLEVVLSPQKHFYFRCFGAAIKMVSGKAALTKLRVKKRWHHPRDKVEAKLHFHAQVASQGRLNLFWESGVHERLKISQRDIDLQPGAQVVELKLDPPKSGYGHALVASFQAKGDEGKSEKRDHFTVSDNFFRICIYKFFDYRVGFAKEDFFRKIFESEPKTYTNYTEIFAWAQEDMVEMSSESDHWFAGQTAYPVRKQGLKALNRMGDEYGFACTTYAKFSLSGYLGWKYAYDHPYDHKGAYGYYCGMYNSTDVFRLDRFRYGELPSQKAPKFPGLLQSAWRSAFAWMPLDPDHTPLNVRTAAEEMVRSIAMFGWDGMRWDDHPRGYGNRHTRIGGNSRGKYDHSMSQKTQTLNRYFKDIVKQSFPECRFGYNYLLSYEEPNYDWALEDHELDELCEGGGLLMNESIRKFKGKELRTLVKHLQIQGDLVRERGGHFLCISSDMVTKRDSFLEAMLYFAGGVHPSQAAAKFRVLNRFATRYADLVFDESRRRLAKPEEVIRPVAKTSLWWQPFVFESADRDGERLLIVNLFNLDPKFVIEGEIKKGFAPLKPGCEKAGFRIALPKGLKMKRALVIDPLSLDEKNLELAGQEIEVPGVNLWSQLVIVLDAPKGAPKLSGEFGAPKTKGERRESFQGERREAFVLSPDVKGDAANVAIDKHFPVTTKSRWDEDPSYAKLSFDERNAILYAKRRKVSEHVDVKLGKSLKGFGDMRPLRNGRMDVYYAQGAFADRLSVVQSLCGLDKFSLQESYLAGAQTKYKLFGERLEAADFASKDLLVYHDIPWTGIGDRDCFALLEYVKEGGALYVAGGEYAYGKGQYLWTVLDRELLPVHSLIEHDHRYFRKPLEVGKGPDFASLGVDIEFKTAPVSYTISEVALKPGVKVFLKCGNRPLLVGWELGKGRVACLLSDVRGKSKPGSEVFFEWKEWRNLQLALFKWLSPDHAKVEKRTIEKKTLARLQKLKAELEESAADDMLENLGDDSEEEGENMDTGSLIKSRVLEKEVLAEREMLIRESLRSGRNDLLDMLLTQLASVENLDTRLRFDILAKVATLKSERLLEIAKSCLADHHARVRQMGLLLLALSSDREFGRRLKGKVPSDETDAKGYVRYLSFAMAIYKRSDLLRFAKKELARIDANELRDRNKYTGGGDFHPGAPATLCLDTPDLIRRLGCLIYLARQNPSQYARRYAREWAMIPQYIEYGHRTIEMLGWSIATARDKRIVKNRRASMNKVRVLQRELSAFLKVNKTLSDELMKSQTNEMLTGFNSCEFYPSARHLRRYLSTYSRKERGDWLNSLSRAKHPILKEYAELGR